MRAELLSDVATASDVASQVALLRALQELTATAQAVMGDAALRVDAATRAREEAQGVPVRRQGLGVAREIGLAVRSSSHAARILLGTARVLDAEMPHARAALRSGHLTAERARILVQETACLPLAARQHVDRELCADPTDLEGVGTKRLTALARGLAASLDPAAVVERHRKAAASRAVWVRPLPDGMCQVSARLPLAQGVAVYASLKAAADTTWNPGPDTLAGADDQQPRGRGAIMADTLVERVTGQADAAATPVQVCLVVSDAALLGADHEPAHLLDSDGAGYGMVPAQVARTIVAAGLEADAVWLRRLYSDPAGDLVAASSSRRFFADGLAAWLRVRDQGICRTPWCDAPVRHLDHVRAFAEGGPTSLANGAGLCVECNQAKEAHGWSARPERGSRSASGRHEIVTTTAAGRTYRSTAPQPPQPMRPAVPARDPALERAVDSVLETVLSELIDEWTGEAHEAAQAAERQTLPAHLG